MLALTAAGAILVTAIAILAHSNGLVRMKNEVANAWSMVDVLLQRRHDLIPNFVETVRGYASHEATAIASVLEAHNSAVALAGGAAYRANAELMLTQSLKPMLALSQVYPNLKADMRFCSLEDELRSTENKIEAARLRYNDAVLRYNNALETFPRSIFVNRSRFQPAAPFSTEPAVRLTPQVRF